MGLFNTGLLMNTSAPSYLDMRRANEDRAQKVGQAIGQLGGGLYGAYRKTKADDMYKRAMGAWDQEQHAADQFVFDEDAYQQSLQPVQDVQYPQEELVQQSIETTEIPVDEYDSLLDQSYMEQRDANPDLVALDMDMGIAGQSTEPAQTFETEVEAFNAPLVEQGMSEDEYIKAMEAEKESQYNALFASPEERTQYEANRDIFKDGMNEEQKYRRVAELMAPLDMDISRKMNAYADERSKLERQLGAQEQAANNPLTKLKTAMSDARIVLGIKQDAVTNARERWTKDPDTSTLNELNKATKDFKYASNYYDAINTKWRELGGIEVILDGTTDTNTGDGTIDTNNTDDNKENARKTSVVNSLKVLSNVDAKGNPLTLANKRKQLGDVKSITQNEIEDAMRTYEADVKSGLDIKKREQEINQARQDQHRQQQKLASDVIREVANTNANTKAFESASKVQSNYAAFTDPEFAKTINDNPAAAMATMKAFVQSIDPGSVNNEEFKSLGGGDYAGIVGRLKSLFTSGATNENAEGARNALAAIKKYARAYDAYAIKKSKKMAVNANKIMSERGLSKYGVTADASNYYQPIDFNDKPVPKPEPTSGLNEATEDDF